MQGFNDAPAAGKCFRTLQSSPDRPNNNEQSPSVDHIKKDPRTESTREISDLVFHTLKVVPKKIQNGRVQ